MSIPDYQSIMHPLLHAIADGQTYHNSELFETMAEQFNLSDQDKRVRIASGGQLLYRNRIAWARTYLSKAGLLDIPSRGQSRITARGTEAVESGQTINLKYLNQFSEFRDFFRPKNKPEDSKEDTNQPHTPEEQMARAHRAYNDALKAELLETIRKASPEFFEKLVLDLMLAMGYGGFRDGAGSVTPYGNDNGIDGFINEDKLGLDTVYLQAKRWQNTVQRPEVDKFIGALTRLNASKGVMITTSDFSTGAAECVTGLNTRIALINGDQLAELMIEHRLGLSNKNTYTIQTIDSDYFSGEDG